MSLRIFAPQSSERLSAESLHHLLRGALGLLMLSLLLVPGHAAGSPIEASAAGIAAEEDLDRSVAEKSGDLCNLAGNYCTGKWADLIDHLFTNSDGSVNIYVSPNVKTELDTKGYCALQAGFFIDIVPQNGNERVMLDQLYISYAMDLHFAIRLWPDATTGECTLAYIRALYN